MKKQIKKEISKLEKEIENPPSLGFLTRLSYHEGYLQGLKKALEIINSQEGT